ncbi:carboxypeptidase S [Trametes maxima]|nr:carboxypeptidase S [Trametes maxima]
MGAQGASHKLSRAGSSKRCWSTVLVAGLLSLFLFGSLASPVASLYSRLLVPLHVGPLGCPRTAFSGELASGQAQHGLPLPSSDASNICPQADPLLPVEHYALDDRLTRRFGEIAYRQAAFETFGGALRIPTVSYDDQGPVGEDRRWDVFAELHQYLEEAFPRVFAGLHVTKINTYGIVLHWQGSNRTLQPVLMTAHQDVVPVDPATLADWLNPPFSGLYDGTWIWGRGSCDDKSDLVASLQAIDALLEQGFEPHRTFVWAFGFDEETAGSEGAGHLAPYLEDRYGTNGFSMLLDEGGSAYGTAYGGDVVFAFPALSEKGYLDLQVEVSAPGGHSSIPPEHTAIGMLAAMIVELEGHPHPAVLTRESGAFRTTQCTAAYAPEYPEHIRKLAQEAVHSDDALEALERALLETFPGYEAFLRTTQAADLIEGGVKVNALPERATAVVNHRIVESSSVADVQARIVELLRPLAARFDLTMDAFDRTLDAGTGTGGHLALSVAFGRTLDPSPVTPTGRGDPYQIFVGTVRGMIGGSMPRDGSHSVVVVPQLEVGNTDTARYWNLTRHIVRYSHVREGDRYNGFHTVNEAIRADGWLGSVRFYTRFILNWDEHL